MALPNLNTPNYELKLPSTGKIVTYRPYLVKEEKILMLAMEADDSKQTIQAIKDVVTACTSESGLNVNKITTFDLEYIFLNLRSKSVGSLIKIKPKCKSTGCDHLNENVHIDLDKNVVNIDLKSKDSIIKLTPTIAVKMRYPTVAHIERLGGDSDTTDTNKLFDLITVCIESILTEDESLDADQQTKEDLDTFIGQMTSDQFKMLQHFIEGIPSVSNTVEFDCELCGDHNSLEIKGINNFFQ